MSRGFSIFLTASILIVEGYLLISSISRALSSASTSDNASISYFSISLTGSLLSLVRIFRLFYLAAIFSTLIFLLCFGLYLSVSQVWEARMALFLSFSFLSNLWSSFISAYCRCSPMFRSFAVKFLFISGSWILLIKAKTDSFSNLVYIEFSLLS